MKEEGAIYDTVRENIKKWKKERKGFRGERKKRIQYRTQLGNI